VTSNVLDIFHAGHGRHTLTRQPTPLGMVVRRLARSLKAMRRRWREAKAIDTLTQLDPSILRNIGIEPWQIREVAREIATRPGADSQALRRRP